MATVYDLAEYPEYWPVEVELSSGLTAEVYDMEQGKTAQGINLVRIITEDPD